MQAYVRRRKLRHTVALGQNPQLRRKCSGFDDSHGEPLSGDGFNRREAVAYKRQAPRSPGIVERLSGPFPEQTSMRIERDRKRVQRFDLMQCSGSPDRLLAPQKFAFATTFRMRLLPISQPLTCAI